MTDPGPPPEEALDATLRALGAPVPPQARRAAESAGLDAAHYHAEPRRLARGRDDTEPTGVLIETDPDLRTPITLERDTARMPNAQQANTTIPRGPARPNRFLVFLMATGVVVITAGIIAWFAMRAVPPSAAAVASAAPSAVPSAPIETAPTATAAAAPAPTLTSEPPSSTAPVAASADVMPSTAQTPTNAARPTTPTTAAPRRPSTPQTTSTATSSPSAPASTAAPAATTKYNHLLNEEK